MSGEAPLSGTRFKRDDVIVENNGGHREFGLVLQSGKVSYDVIWIGGMTTRYRYATGRQVRVATEHEIAEDLGAVYLKGLREDAAQARDERRRGAGIKRGQIWP